MSGVINDNGQQWKHCCHCREFTKIEELEMGYSPKWPKHDWVDLCPSCYHNLKIAPVISKEA